MVEHDFGVAHATMLESRGRFFEAADVRVQEGDVLYAIRLLLQDHQSSAASERAAALVLEDLWRTLSFAVMPTNDNAEHLETLFNFMDQLGKVILSSSQQQEVGDSSTVLASCAY